MEEKQMKKLILLFLIIPELCYSINYQYEAENMFVEFGRIQNEGDHVIMLNSSSLSFMFNYAGSADITIRAKEDHYPGEFSHLGIAINDIYINYFIIDKTEWAEYTLSFPAIQAGKWTLTFTNPKYDSVVGDKNIYLDYIIIDYHEPEPPAPPTNVDTLYSYNNKVKILWDTNTEPDLKGYKLYYGFESGQYDHVTDIGNMVSYSLEGLQYNIIYYVAVTAYDSLNNESGYSEEIAFMLIHKNKLAGDISIDGIVDIQDLVIVTSSWAKPPGQADIRADINKDGFVDIQDLIYITSQWGMTE